ncbi:hypothetical protein A6B39_07240 [Mannheimia granulomatis]|nr:hypothetical protein A6B39_07240 [Mannheimia granulomatis]
MYRILKKEYDYSWIIVIFIHLIFYFILDSIFDLINKNKLFYNISDHLNQYGLSDFIRNNYKNIRLIIWIITYISGVLFLILILKEVVISIFLLSSNRFFNKNRIIWGAKKVILTFVISFISYLCISGKLYILLIETGPKEFQILLNHILYGQRG